MENIFVEFLPPWVETGMQPAFYDKESGTVLQQTARMYSRVNMLIRMFNKLSKETKETVEDYIGKFNELAQYVNNYFDNLDVQEEINNKLDAMEQSGQLAEIINEEIFGELNDEIDQLGDDLDDLRVDTDILSRNKKWTLALFLDTAERQAEEYVTELMTRGANAGFGSCQMIIHIQNDGTLVEDTTKFDLYNTIANSLHIPITSVKFHGSRNATRYSDVILECLAYFPDADTAFVMNEQADYIYSDGLGYPSIIKNAYANIKKVGFTVSYSRGFYNLNGYNITPAQWNQVMSTYDILGMNVYPSCGNYQDYKNVEFAKIKSSFNIPPFLLNWNKELWVTESGVLPYWQMLELPESWNTALLSDTTKDTTPQKLFLKGLAESDIAERADKIVPWYVESGMSDTNHELFNILRTIMKGE